MQARVIARFPYLVTRQPVLLQGTRVFLGSRHRPHRQVGLGTDGRDSVRGGGDCGRAFTGQPRTKRCQCDERKIYKICIYLKNRSWENNQHQYLRKTKQEAANARYRYTDVLLEINDRPRAKPSPCQYFRTLGCLMTASWCFLRAGEISDTIVGAKPSSSPRPSSNVAMAACI